MVYYNENDPYAARWLRNLIDAGHLPGGKVCDYDIRYISPKEVEGYEQCHFFAGVGGWPYALELAGWRGPVWTGSCPCQPFSCAGKGRGTDDPRHLWPVWLPLIAECRPPVIFGEQVASPAGRRWLARVYADLEALGYAVAGADLCAPSTVQTHEAYIQELWRDEKTGEEGWDTPVAVRLTAPHIRQRLFWVADRAEHGCDQERADGSRSARGGQTEGWPARPGLRGSPRRLGNTMLQGQPGQPQRLLGATAQDHWSNYDLVQCADGKSRRVESGTFPLAPRLSESLERLCSIIVAANERIDKHATQTRRDAGQVLHALRMELQSKAISGTPRGQASVLEAQILLAFLCSLGATRSSPTNRSRLTKKGGQVHCQALQFLRLVSGTVGTPRGWQPDEQRVAEHPDSLRALSLVLACDAKAYWTEANNAHAATNRVGKLRAYGNAIVPGLAAVFIQSFMEARDEAMYEVR